MTETTAMSSITSISAFEEWFEKAAVPGPEREIPSSVVIALDRDGMLPCPKIPFLKSPVVISVESQNQKIQRLMKTRNHLHQGRGHPIREPLLPPRLQAHLRRHRHVGGLLHQAPLLHLPPTALGAGALLPRRPHRLSPPRVIRPLHLHRLQLRRCPRVHQARKGGDCQDDDVPPEWCGV